MVSDIEGALRVLSVIRSAGGGRAAERVLSDMASAGNVLDMRAGQIDVVNSVEEAIALLAHPHKDRYL